MFSLFIQEEVLYIPKPINLCLAAVRGSEDETESGGQTNTLFHQLKRSLQEHIFPHKKKKYVSMKKKWKEKKSKISIADVSSNHTLCLQMQRARFILEKLSGIKLLIT